MYHFVFIVQLFILLSNFTIFPIQLIIKIAVTLDITIFKIIYNYSKLEFLLPFLLPTNFKILTAVRIYLLARFHLDHKSTENSSFQYFLFLFKIIEYYLKTPKNSPFIIQDYLKLFRRIQRYNVFPRVFPRQDKKSIQEKLILYIYCISYVTQIFELIFPRQYYLKLYKVI